MIKKFTESIAVFSVVIVLFGLVKQYVYYLRFDVPIKYFITISELGAIVSDDLLIVGLAVSIILFGIYLSIDYSIPIEEIEKQNRNRKELLEKLRTTNPTKYREIVRSKKWLIILLFIGCLAGAIFMKSYGTKLILVTVLIMLAPYFMLVFNSDRLYSYLSGQLNYIYLTIVLSVIAYMSFLAVQISSVENGRFTGTIIKTADSTYISTKDSYFIGKTEKFIFFYDSKTNATTIIPADNVTIISLKQNSTYSR